jgi:hypothetical protein
MRDTTNALEEMVEGLHDDVKKIKTESAAIEEKVNSLITRGAIQADDGKRLKEMLAEIDSVLSKYKT